MNLSRYFQTHLHQHNFTFSNMEEKKKIMCTECQKEMLEENAFKTEKGPICEDCRKKAISNMEEKKTIKCTKCQKEILEENAFKTKKGPICEDCRKKAIKRKRIIAGSSSAGIIAAAVAAITLTTTDPKTGVGFDGVTDIQDSVTLKASMGDTNFDISTAVVQSSTVSVGQTVNDIESFNSALSQNISNAKNSKENKFEIPSIGAMFEINTNYFANGGQNLISEFAKAYLQTNKQATILVEGYTCDLGGEQLNTNLSKLRAEAVKKTLVDAGGPSDKIETKCYGKSRFKDFNYPNKSDYRRVIVSIK